jgi:hypothetical protein
VLRIPLDVVTVPPSARTSVVTPTASRPGAAKKPGRKKRSAATKVAKKPIGVVVPVTAEPELTALSLGGGQDSTELLYRLIFDPEFRARYAPRRLLVVFADTMDEHTDTYHHLNYLGRLCAASGIELVRLSPEKGFHGTGSWAKGLTEFYRASRTIGSKCFKKSCTDNLKIKPIYRYLADRLARDYGFARHGQWFGKQPLIEFAKKFGRIRVLIGFAAGEEKRVADASKLPVWMRHTVERSFPLIDLKLDRAACIAAMHARGLPVPPPSLCQRCPYKSEIELLWTAHHLPEVYADWVVLEAAKLEKFAEKGRDNFGVFGRRTLPMVLADAKQKYAHLTSVELDEYRMSHGHCVGSAY